MDKKRPREPNPQPSRHGELSVYLDSADKLRATLNSKSHDLQRVASVQAKYRQAIDQTRRAKEVTRQSCVEFEEYLKDDIEAKRRELEELSASDIRRDILAARQTLAHLQQEYRLLKLENSENGIRPELAAQKRTAAQVLAVYESLRLVQDDNLSVEERWQVTRTLSSKTQPAIRNYDPEKN